MFQLLCNQFSRIIEFDILGISLTVFSALHSMHLLMNGSNVSSRRRPCSASLITIWLLWLFYSSHNDYLHSCAPSPSSLSVCGLHLFLRKHTPQHYYYYCSAITLCYSREKRREKSVGVPWWRWLANNVKAISSRVCMEVLKSFGCMDGMCECIVKNPIKASLFFMIVTL